MNKQNKNFKIFILFIPEKKYGNLDRMVIFNFKNYYFKNKVLFTLFFFFSFYYPILLGNKNKCMDFIPMVRKVIKKKKNNRVFGGGKKKKIK